MRLVTGAAALLAALALAGCSGGARPESEQDAAIEIFGPYRGVEADRFVETLDRFVDATEIDVRYVGSQDFVSDLRRRVEKASDPPDVAVVPQPGLVAELARQGSLVPLGPSARAGLADNYGEDVTRLATINGVPYTVPFRVVVKSLVWYRPGVFAGYGWSVPRTLDELERLVEQIEGEDGPAPWCFTMAAGTATGWTATDWTEDLVLRDAGAERYRGWVTGEVAFADTAIEEAFDHFQSLVLENGRVAGGLENVLETPVDEASVPLFASPPGCALYKQADFAESWFPAGTEIGPAGDVNWFVLPGRAETGGVPIVLGGDQVVQFRRDQDVDALMAYLAGPQAGITWARRGGFLSPKTSIPESAYREQHFARLAETLRSASTVAFDASDQMPPDIGSGLLWSSITEWVAGAVDYATFAATIDRARAGDVETAATGR